MKSNKLKELTWTELGQEIKDGMGVILPIGATEQHGKHLPLYTDSFFAENMAIDVSQETNMLVAPTIEYGTNSRPLSGGGQGFIGSTSIDAEIFIKELTTICKEFMRHGFKKIVLYNWHGENSSFVYEAAWLAMDKGQNKDVKMMVFGSPFEALLSDEIMKECYPEGFPSWPREHAGILETSMMLYLKPEYVNMDEASDEISKEYPWWETLPIQDDYITSCGSLWKETQATKEKGKMMWEYVVKSLTKAINYEFSRK